MNNCQIAQHTTRLRTQNEYVVYYYSILRIKLQHGGHSIKRTEKTTLCLRIVSRILEIIVT